MKKLAAATWGITCLGMVMVIFIFSGTSWGEEAAPTPVQPKFKTEVEEERPPELKPELKPSQGPESFPSVVPPQRSQTLEIGPASGILAPYGNPTALDTLRLGKALKAGPLQVAPYLETDIGYRTNLFQTPNDKRATSVFAFNPGMYMELPLAQRHKISVGYLGNGITYPSKDLDNYSHYDNNVNVDASFNFPGGLSLRAGNYLKVATEEPTTSNIHQRFYHQWTPYFLANYAFADKWKVQAIYEFNKLYFAKSAQSPQNDYNENVGGLTLYYKFWPKTSVLGQFVVSQRTYPSQKISNNYTYTPMVGLTWDATAKLTGVIKAGYTMKDFESTRLSSLNQTPSTPALSAQVTYKFDRRTNLALTAQRSIQQDVDVSGNAAYTNMGIYLTLSHEWAFWRLSSSANIAYTFNDYINRSLNPGDGRQFRQDSIIFTGVGLSRPLTRYLKLKLDYSYNNRASNFNGFGYNEHRILFAIQATM